MLLRQIAASFFFCAVYVTSMAQQGNYTQSRSFTMADGLPSNHLYFCLEDNKGFLWVATDAGIARFDGKYFQVFTTQDGLPDDEVLYLIKETDGTIWINCFKQGPVYFDEIKNRFIKPQQDTVYSKFYGTNIPQQFTTIPEGGVKYQNDNGLFIFRDKKLVSYSSSIIGPGWFHAKQNPDGTSIILGFIKNDQKKKLSAFTIALIIRY